MLGWEWPFYASGQIDATYPPYLYLALKPLSIWDWRTGVGLLNGPLLMTVAVSTAREALRQGDRRSSRLSAAALALLTAPVLMLMWEGHAAPVTLFGLLALPFGVPYALIQPHIAPWSLLARRRWTLFAIGFGLLTLAIWGLWPLQVIGLASSSIAHPIAMGWSRLGWPVLLVGLLMLLNINADPLRLMAMGAFITPYANAVHFVLLLPAIGRVRGWRRLLLWLGAWLAVLPYGFGSIPAKYAAMLFPLAVWWFLRPQSKTD
jgi:hypothetical protein